MDKKTIESYLDFLPKKLAAEIAEISFLKTFPENTTILSEGQVVMYLPIVVNGLIKVFTGFDGKELLLYYIEPKQSCIMSFASGVNKQPSRVFAITEEPTTMVLLPTEQLNRLTRNSEDFNLLFFDLYNKRYAELLDTINHLLFSKLDERLLNYIEKKMFISEVNSLKISHKQIASELGTAREVITRLIKKLEHEQRIIITDEGITIKK